MNNNYLNSCEMVDISLHLMLMNGFLFFISIASANLRSIVLWYERKIVKILIDDSKGEGSIEFPYQNK